MEPSGVARAAQPSCLLLRENVPVSEAERAGLGAEFDVIDWLIVAVTALACFGLCGSCVYYLVRSSHRVRWSRSTQMLITRHPIPVVFWTKVIIVAMGAFVSLALGIVLLAFHGKAFFRGGFGGSKPTFEAPDTGGPVSPR